MTVPVHDTLTPGTGAGGQQVALVDLLDRLLAGGVVIAGDVVISIADIDLVHISLRALITSVREELLPDVPR
ncbi:gas vesicle protein [Spirillospora sp. CA-294931]|uniref:gas vesicle protein n=1 Tax=Spirillospora sp. CA-294931 TaxID=3240042 RepID=UPI003D8EDF5F